MRELSLGPIRFCVEHRSAAGDGGPTLRVREDEGDRELLRFDCFDRSPHFHVDPGGRDELTRLDPLADNVAWTLDALRKDLAGWLDKAGLTADASALDDAQRSRALDTVEGWLRNPPAALDALDLPLLRSRLSEKWNVHPQDVLPAWVAEMDFPLADPIRRVMQRAVDHFDVGYPISPRDTGVLEAFAHRMESRFGWRVDPARCEILSDVVQGMYIALLAWADAGDGAVVQTPIYPPFLTAVRDTGRRLVENRLVASDGGFSIDFDALRRAADPKTRIALLANPHNPTGRVFTRAELEELARLALERDWVVVSDEIHADLVYPGRSHIPFASLSPEIAARTLTLTSATKAFNIPGLRCAIAHFGSPDLQTRFAQTLPRHVRGGIGILGLYATVAAWRHAQPWLDEVLAYLEGNRDFLGAFLRDQLPEVGYRAPEATYLGWLDCSRLPLPGSPAAFFRRRARVALSDGHLFGEGLERHARINFATSRALLTQVLERMVEARAAL